VALHTRGQNTCSGLWEATRKEFVINHAAPLCLAQVERFLYVSVTDPVQAIGEIGEAARGLGPSGCLRVAVTGSRGVGKSTLARLLVNALLGSAPCVAFLDTDLGQPEFTPSGGVPSSQGVNVTLTSSRVQTIKARCIDNDPLQSLSAPPPPGMND